VVLVDPSAIDHEAPLVVVDRLDRSRATKPLKNVTIRSVPSISA
jgi:hypothetical protein